MFLKFLLDAATDAAGSDSAAKTGCSTTDYIIYGVLIALLIGFFVWSTISSKKRQKKEKEKLDGMKIGDRVKTIGGVCGFVVDINDAENTFTLETGYGDNKSYVKFDKAAVYQTAPNGAETAPAPTAEVPAEEAEKPEEKTESAEQGEAQESVSPENEEHADEKDKKKKNKNGKDRENGDLF